jgi:hypothetical protein
LLFSLRLEYSIPYLLVFSSLFIYNLCIVFFADSHSFLKKPSLQAYAKLRQLTFTITKRDPGRQPFDACV